MMAQRIVNRAFRLDHIASSVASCRCWILAQAVGIAIGRRIRSRCCRGAARRLQCNAVPVQSDRTMAIAEILSEAAWRKARHGPAVLTAPASLQGSAAVRSP